MTDQTSTAAEVYTESGTPQSHGLHAGALGPVETLAQSVSAMAPSTSASLTIPLVFALAGNATWFVYLMATAATLLVGFCISRFAQLSASPGSLYSYTADTLPPFFSVIAAWALLLAYLATGASVAGGGLYYTNLLTQQFFHASPPSLVTLFVTCLLAACIAYRDVKLSAELMLWIEVGSVSLIVLVLMIMPVRLGLHIDLDQLSLKGASLSALGPALVLAMFSFVGFEAATTLGGEARNPLHTIPRAVLQCAVLAGIFFMLCAYSEVLGFRGESGDLSQSTSPLHHLAQKAGVSPLGIGIDFGALISMFACVLACTTAAARVLLRMAQSRLLPGVLGNIDKRHRTPGAAVILSTGVMFLATAGMQLRAFNGSEMYDLFGSLAVFGFLTAYALVAIALPFARLAVGRHSHLLAVVSVFTVLVLLLIAVYDLRSTADALHARIPWIYLAYIGGGMAWYAIRRKAAATERA